MSDLPAQPTEPMRNAPGAPPRPGSVTISPFSPGVRLRYQESISRLRHALRTPLNQVIGYTEMLLESAEELKAGSLLRDLKRIHNAGGQLLAHVNDALASWKIDVGQVDIAGLERDLRTPLNTVIGYAELCHDEATASGRADLAQDLQKIRAAAKNLEETFRNEAIPLAKQMDAAATLGLHTLSQPPFPLPSAGTTAADYITSSAPPLLTGRILLVDDDAANRDMLGRRLRKLGFEVEEAADGHEALQKLKGNACDLVLLDVMMPGLDGFQTLEYMKADPRLRHVPAIMLTALDDAASTVRCIEAGAEDYVPKPFNAVILRARIAASLEKKRLRDQEQAFIAEIQNERAKSERLLLNVLPKPIADRLKAGERTIVDSFIEATVVFADIVGFTHIAARQSPQRTAQLLNEIFSNFDRIADQFGLEKIKTIGDAYMLVGGVPVIRDDHATACAAAAFEMLESLRAFNRRHELEWGIRIGMNSGPVVAGIIGTRKFSYDLWGDTVNIASRMESHGQPGKIQVSESTKRLLQGHYDFDPVGLVELKNTRPMQTFLLRRKGA
jgi:adenylate cyclase